MAGTNDRESRGLRRRQSPGPSISRRSETQDGKRFAIFLASFLLFVVAIQIALRFHGVRRYLNASIRLEGFPLNEQVEGLGAGATSGLGNPPNLWTAGEPAGAGAYYPWIDSGSGGSSQTSWIRLRLLAGDGSNVWVLLNGRPVRKMDDGGGTVWVQDGDSVAVFSPEQAVTVVVADVSAGLASPQVGSWAAGSGILTVCDISAPMEENEGIPKKAIK